MFLKILDFFLKVQYSVKSLLRNYLTQFWKPVTCWLNAVAVWELGAPKWEEFLSKIKVLSCLSKHWPLSIGFCFSTLNQHAASIARKRRVTATVSKKLAFLFSDLEIKSDALPSSFSKELPKMMLWSFVPSFPDYSTGDYNTQVFIDILLSSDSHKSPRAEQADSIPIFTK